MLAESTAGHGVDEPGEERDRTGYLTALAKASSKYLLGDGI
jgi:hypothetical protein